MADAIFVVKKWRRRPINNRTLNATGFIQLWIGVILTYGGLLVLQGDNPHVTH
jgi:hypothetical protein